MPRYDYECQNCGFVEEKIFKIADKPDWTTCRECGGPAKSIIGGLRPAYVQGDFEPYYDESLDTMIESKRHRREVMAREGLVELGPLGQRRRKEIRDKAEYFRHERPREIGRDDGKPKGTIFHFMR